MLKKLNMIIDQREFGILCLTNYSDTTKAITGFSLHVIFFRSRQFMSTMIATTILGMLLTASLPSLVAATIAAIFILFAIAYQLKPIFSHYAQHRIARIYPQDSEKQLADFQLLATKIFSPIVLLLLICLLFGHQSTAVSISFLIIGLVAWLIVKGYLPRLVGFKYEIKK